MSVSRLRVQPGKPYPLGATWDGNGVNFALFSAHAEKVVLCLFDKKGTKETHRIAITENTNEVWHVYLPDVRPGQLYGYRVYGHYAPEHGFRFNHHKLLLDPYAKALAGKLTWNEALLGYDPNDPRKDLSFNDTDSSMFVPKSVVCETAYTWGKDMPPKVSWRDTVVYEAHTRGFTMLHPDVPSEYRGTFAGLSQPEIVHYLKDLGVTSLELLPVHAFFGDKHMDDGILDNYWGYESMCFFAPEQRYLATKDIGEFKTMVSVMHNAGIEVILDVVYNHTGEGNQMGPTLCYRGIDNLSYYKLAQDKRYYYDTTGCGASFNTDNQRVVQLVVDSLRYWATEMHVDGFRFDLAPSLCRRNGGFDQSSAFLNAVQQDPVLQEVKLISEPWDCSSGGYQLGAFPPGWLEWNDRFRDNTRRFWRSDERQIAEMASRITGSSDIFGYRGRKPWASVNFLTAHDGFTLNDTVSYNQKHNLANNEGNRDGTDSNWSWNGGIEGITDNKEINDIRMRRIRSMFASLLLSQGTPMIVAGDEFARTQRGNNNAYCQDNVISWINWQGISGDGVKLLKYVRSLIKLRKEHSVFRRLRFFKGEKISGTDLKDITWLKPSGDEMCSEDWNSPAQKYLGFLISGAAGMAHYTEQGELAPDSTFLGIMNGSSDTIDWTLPSAEEHDSWELLLDSAKNDEVGSKGNFVFGKKVKISPWSFVLLQGKLSTSNKELIAKERGYRPIAVSVDNSDKVVPSKPFEAIVEQSTNEINNVASSEGGDFTGGVMQKIFEEDK